MKRNRILQSFFQAESGVWETLQGVRGRCHMTTQSAGGTKEESEMNNVGEGRAEKDNKPDENGWITEDTMAGLGATEPGQDPVGSRVFDPSLVTVI